MQATLDRLRQRRDERGDEGGFTLIELLIVIVILAILAAIVVFAVQNLAGTSAKASCQSDFKTVQTAVEAYKSQMGAYPKGGGTAGNVSSSTATDSDTSNTPTLTSGALTAGTNLAAADGGELLTGSSNAATGFDFQTPAKATKNLVSPAGSASGDAVGPWLKTVPANGNHYTITVSNDGTGLIQVFHNGALDANCDAVS